MPKPNGFDANGNPIPPANGGGAPNPNPYNLGGNNDQAATIAQLEKVIEQLKKKPTLPGDIVTEVQYLMASLGDLHERVVALNAKLLTASTMIEEPVFVFRYFDTDDKEGYVEKSEADAELKARRRAKNGVVEFGYAYRDKDGKFGRFVAIPGPPVAT